MGPRYCSWWKEHGIRKPAGGWAPVHVEAVCQVWSLRHTDIRVARLIPRVYFALVEVAQRRGTGRAQAKRASYGPHEVCQLIGLEDNPRNHGWIRRAVTVLREADLIQWEKNRLQIRTRFPDVGMSSMSEQIKRSARRIPVPRRLLRRLAAAGRAEMATLLGALIRCLHNHRDVIRRAGRLQVTWVASIFGLSRSAIITAKKKLLSEGVLAEHTTPQWEMNKAGWGVRTTINVNWSPTPPGSIPGSKPEITSGGTSGSVAGVSGQEGGLTSANTPDQTESSVDPHNTPALQNPARSRSDSERPCLNHHLSSSKQEEKHQQPGRERHRPVGVFNPNPAPGISNPETRVEPCLKLRPRPRITSGGRGRFPGVVAEDLGSLERLGELFHQRNGRWGGSGDRDYLDHVAAAVRAKSRGRDATAMFAWSLRHPEQIRKYITSDEEEQARRWILRERGGIDPVGRGTGESGGAVDGHLSDKSKPSAEMDADDRVVRACIETASKPCGRGVEPFVLARRFKQWTRTRWDTAYAAYRLKLAGRSDP